MRVSLAALLLTAALAHAGPKVAVVTGPDAPKLERLAANELAAQLKQLVNADVAVADKPPAATEHLILVGSPATNPTVAKAVGDRWPKLSDQGHVLKSATLGDRPVLVAGGGSPVATLWAAYEVGHHFGVRPTLHGDALPEKVPPLKLGGIDLTFEPVVAVRAWRVLDDSPARFGGWGLDDHKALFRQLAKFKFNRVVLGIDAEKPPLPFGGRRFPVAGDTPGRKAFRGAKEFENPALAGKTTDADRRAALGALARAVAEAAGEFGLAVGPPPAGVPTTSLTGFLPRLPAPTLPAAGILLDVEVPGDLGATAYDVSRRAFDRKLTPRDSRADYFTPTLGPNSADRVAVGIGRIEEATALIAKNDPTFPARSPEMIRKHLSSTDPPPDWWKAASKLYAEASDEMQRAIRATFHDPARPALLYHAKRCEFAVHYFAALDAARRAGQAKSKGDRDAQVEQLEKATESMYNALTAYGDVARDPSDRGAIAALAEYAYRPLQEALKRAEKGK